MYRVRGAPLTTRQRLLATTLWAGDDCAISHLAAGRLLRLDAVPKPMVIDVSVGRATGLATNGVVVHRTPIDRIDRVTVDGIRCTSATRTIIDLAAVLDGETLEASFESARRLGLTAPSTLAKRAAAICGRGRPGSALVRHLLAVLEHRPLEFAARSEDGSSPPGARATRRREPVRGRALPARLRLAAVAARRRVRRFRAPRSAIVVEARSTEDRSARSVGVATDPRHLGRRHQASRRKPSPASGRRFSGPWRSRGGARRCPSVRGRG